MSAACAGCGRAGFPAGARFCSFCGVPLAGASRDLESYTPAHLLRDVLGSAAAREGERKEVTLLFADVAGSLAMAQALDPEDIHEIMDGFFGLALRAVHRERGTINQFRGDGFMALFGAPRARGEDVGRALRAALAIRAELAGYGDEVARRFRVPLRLRMGLHTGIVWVGTIGIDLRSDYTAEGPTVGLAARLERAARPGQILISEETAARAERDFEVRELRARRFRGVPGSVRVFELVGARASGTLAERRPAPRSPFVGRERELRWLAAQTRDDAPVLLEIRGEAGIGKSRLAREHVARAAPDTTALELRCRESELANAYAPWLELLARWPGDLPGAGNAAALAERFGGRESDAGGTPEIFTAALASLLAAAGALGAGLTVLIDDAHWLDPTSALVLERLAQDPTLRGVGLLLTLRTGDDVPERAFPSAARLALGPLAPAESEGVSRAILAGLDDEASLVALAVQRGGGNPLFLEEVARSLRDGPPEVRRVARLEAELARSALRIPDTLRGVIAARIDALPDHARAALLAASVVGASFDAELLAEISAQGAPRSDAALQHLLEAGVLELAARERLDFRHVLIRDVAYAQLVLPRRRQIHEACATAFAKRDVGGTADGAARIGWHYERAGLLEEAAKHLTAAGRAYLRLHAGTEAATHLERAWELTNGDGASPAARISTGLALAAALNGLDRAREAGDVLEALARPGLALSETRKVARACIESGWVTFSERGDADAARKLLERGLELAHAAGDGRLELGAHAYLVRLFDLDGSVALAIASAERVFELALELGDAFYQSFALGSKSSALCHRGDVEAAVAAASEAAALAEESRNDIAIGFAQSFLACALLHRGDASGALRAASRAREAGERSRQAGAVYHAEAWTGEVYLLDGQPERALLHFERMDAINASWPNSRRAAGLLALGHYEEAARLASDCLSRPVPRLARARTLCVLGAALARGAGGDLERALAPIREALALFERLELRPNRAEAELFLAEALAIRDPEAARLHAARAARMYRATGMPRHAERAESTANAVSV